MQVTWLLCINWKDSMQLRKLKLSLAEQAQVYKITCAPAWEREPGKLIFSRICFHRMIYFFLKWTTYYLHLNLQYLFSPSFLFTQIITLALFPLEIRLKYVYNMGHFFCPVNYCKPLPDATVKEWYGQAWHSTRSICVSTVLTAVRWKRGFMHAHSLVKD